jgi:flagellar protein FliS
MRYGQEVYQRNSLTTATPGQILIALFDGALRFITVARQGIVDNRPEVKGESIGRVLNILAELAGTLDERYAPDLCEQLRSLYAYFAQRLREASANMDTQPLDEVAQHLTSMRDTWQQALRQGGQDA